VQGAQEALSLCRDLRDNGPGLARSSYIEYSSCRASLLVLIAHSIQTQSADFRAELRVGLDMIREMAASGESAQSEVALLESLERALIRLQHSSDDLNGRGGLGSSDNRQEITGYDSFKNWQAMWEAGRTALPHNASQPPPDYGLPPLSSVNSRPGQYCNILHNHSVGNPYDRDGPAFSNHDLSPTAFDNNPELRFLQEFLAIPGYKPDGSFEEGVVSDLGSSEFPFQ
jgi:hypothetical protein